MNKPLHRDLIIILILSIASVLYLNIPALNLFQVNIIPIILLLFFLPGYSVIAAIYPKLKEISIIIIIFASLGVSIITTILLSLILNYLSLTISIYTILSAITILLTLIALLRRILSAKKIKSPAGGEDKSIEEKIDSEKTPGKVEDDKTSDKVAGEQTPRKIDESDKKDTTPKSRPIPAENWLQSLDLLLVVIFTAICALFILEPSLNKTVVRTVLGLLLVLFFPGYALIASLFPKKDDLDSIERLALSFGLSIAVTPLIGLILNYTPFGIRLDPILISLTSFTLLLCAVAYIRRQRTPVENRFFIDFKGTFQGISSNFIGISKTEKILSTVLILSIIFAIATTAYIIVTPKEGESFTEFYILGPGGMASDYPTNLTPGQEGKVIMGIVNHENKNTSYHLIVTANDTVQLDQTFTLKNGEKLEIPFTFTINQSGESKMEFKLFKLPDDNNIYRSLHLWINVTESTT